MRPESDIDANAETERAREQLRVERDQGENRTGPADHAKTYTVKEGDTLSDIAQSVMGDANRWRELYAANRNAVGDNPDMIHPGLKLDIPD